MKRMFITAIATLLMSGLLASPALAKKSGPTRSNKALRGIVKVTTLVGAGGAHLSKLGIADPENNGDNHPGKIKKDRIKNKNAK